MSDSKQHIHYFIIVNFKYNYLFENVLSFIKNHYIFFIVFILVVIGNFAEILKGEK